MSVSFGDCVNVTALSRRVLREENKSGDGRGDLTYRERSETIAPETAATREWPEPDGKPYVRICRDALPLPAFGIVVGQTKRLEGWREAAYESENPFSMEPEFHDAYFQATAVVPVFEVALAVTPHRKARIVLVQPADLTKLYSGTKVGGAA